MGDNSTGTRNTAIGYLSLKSNTTADDNTALGQKALQEQTTGNNNTAIGSLAAALQTTAVQNTAVGSYSQAYSTGSDNTSLGMEALRGASQGNPGTGGRNVAIGKGCMEDANGNAYRNVAVGWQSLRNIHAGYQNVCLGNSAGDTITTGARNIIIGAETDISSATTNYEYVIGYDVVGKGQDTFYVHGGSGAYNGANSSTWATTSDIRIKKNVVDNNTGLDKLKQIQVRNFDYKNKEEILESSPELTDVIKSVVVKKEGTQLGVIAQEIEKVLPDVVKTQTTGIKTVDTDSLTWYLINAVKELSAEVEQLKSQLNN